MTAPDARVGLTENVHLSITLVFGAGNVYRLIFVVSVPLRLLSFFNIFHLSKLHTTYVFVFISSSLTVIYKALPGEV